MTSSLGRIGGKSTMTVQFRNACLISCNIAVIARDAIHSDELSVDVSQGKAKRR